MKECFIKRGYPESVVDKEMKKVRFSEQGQKPKSLRKKYYLLQLTTHYLVN